MTLDVDAIAVELISGRIGVKEAETAIDEAEPLALDSPSEADAIAREVSALLRLEDRISHSHSLQLVLDLGKLLVAGAERLGALETGWAYGSVGQQLMVVGAYDSAISFFQATEDEFRARDDHMFLR